MTICYTGDYNPNYPRHRVIIRGLREQGVEIIERPVKTLGELIHAIRAHNSSVDYFFLGYSDSRWVWLVKMFARKPIIWDAFYSLYDNWVFDRKLARPGSLKARYYWFLDWICCVSANAVILDTNANIAYFRKTFHLKKKQFIRVLVGSDDSVMIPRPKDSKEKKFIVEFHGKYIPVQGVEYIIRAAKILAPHADIRFVLIGEGQEYENVRSLAEDLQLRNVIFYPIVPYDQLPESIADADVCIGLAGNLDRGARAIPNKVYEASAMGRASITMKGPAIRELYTDRENILLFTGGDSEDLAQKILELKRNPSLLEHIASKARILYLEHGTPRAIGEQLKTELEILHH